jgi:hypothetical protein
MRSSTLRKTIPGISRNISYLSDSISSTSSSSSSLEQVDFDSIYSFHASLSPLSPNYFPRERRVQMMQRDQEDLRKEVLVKMACEMLFKGN